MDSWKRLILLVLTDTFCIVFSVFISTLLLFPEIYPNHTTNMLITGIILLVFFHTVSYFSKLYRKVWKYSGSGEIVSIFIAVTLSIFFTTCIGILIHDHNPVIRFMIVVWMLQFLLIAGTRLAWMIYYFSRPFHPPITYKRTLIIGAGSAGTLLARHLKKNKRIILKPVGFIDDNANKQKRQYYGVSVVGTVDELQEFVQRLKVEHIMIAIPTLKKKELNRILNECSKTKIKTQLIPKIEDLMSGKLSVTHFIDVEIEHLLGREQIMLDTEIIKAQIRQKTILITGAGGSIGSELCRQMIAFQPSKMILVGHGENSIFNIQLELSSKLNNSQTKLHTVIADIQDREQIFELVNEYKPDIIYHAAAHKHVPLMEQNPLVAIKNNVMGTKNIAEAAHEFKVGTFILISTDKAVRPVNIMGATKYIAEMIIYSLSQKSDTKFAAVRFGNVLGSRGSVIPLFKKQIEVGGPVTVTHKDMTRYFMTIKEASQLVIQASALTEGGEIFVLDMGERVRIVELAEKMISLSGYDIDEIGIEFTGIRPGEKLHEELVGDEEEVIPSFFPQLQVVKPNYTREQLEVLEELLYTSPDNISYEISKMIAKNKRLINFHSLDSERGT